MFDKDIIEQVGAIESGGEKLYQCNCDDWKINLPKVNAPLMFMHARNPYTTPGYDGKPFQFCPWCSWDLHVDPAEAD